jgi:lysophospholipase L1-like esterase
MRGSLGTRARGLLIAVLAVVALVGAATPALADGSYGGSGSGSSGHGVTYLALGDSVPFGYRAHAADYSDPAAFVGYPEIVAHQLRLRLLNASCPGETTGSFIDTTAQSNGCENSATGGRVYRQLFPLHVSYQGSQLQYALATLRTRNVGLVTLQLGANDAFICQAGYRGFCSGPTDIAGIAAHVATNLTAIIGALRTEGHYTGRIVVVTYYALNYADLTGPRGVLATQALDSAITAAAAAGGAQVADGFRAFQARATAAGGSSIAAGLVLPNDIHPTLLGQLLLARAVEQVAAD